MDSGNVAVSGDVSLTTDANNGVINLGTLQQSGGDLILTTNGTGDATVVNNAAIDLGASNVGGALSATASAGTITQNGGALTVAGTSAFTTSTADQAITLSNTANALTGAVSLTTSGTAGHVTIDNGTTALGVQGTVSGDFALTSGEALTDSAALSVTGPTTVTTDVADKTSPLDDLASTGGGRLTTQRAPEADQGAADQTTSNCQPVLLDWMLSRTLFEGHPALVQLLLHISHGCVLAVYNVMLCGA